MSKEVEELMIEVPEIEELPNGWECTMEICEYKKWKDQSEWINKLLESAEEMTLTYQEYVGDLVGKKPGRRGIFIPLPDTDSYEKLVKDIVEGDLGIGLKTSLIIRAKALLEKDGEG